MAKLARQKAKAQKKQRTKGMEQIISVALNQVEHEAFTKGVETSILLFSLALRKEGFGQKRLERVINQVGDFTKDMKNGSLTLKDIKATLEQEVNIVMK